MVFNKSVDIHDNNFTSRKNTNDCIDFDYDFPWSYPLTYTDCDIRGNTISGKISVEYSRDQDTITSSVSFKTFYLMNFL